MPDNEQQLDTENAALIAELAKRAQAQIQRRLMPPQAGQATPTTMRAAATLRKAFPADMVGVDVKDMTWDDPSAFSNTLGATPLRLPEGVKDMQAGDPESVEMNPGIDMIFGQSTANSVLAHELQHIRQNRSQDPMDMLRERKMDYEKRPSEQEAEKARDAWEVKHPLQSDPKLSDLLLQRVVVPLFETTHGR